MVQLPEDFNFDTSQAEEQLQDQLDKTETSTSANEQYNLDPTAPESFTTSQLKSFLSIVATYMKAAEALGETAFRAAWAQLIKAWKANESVAPYLDKLYDDELLEATVPRYLHDKSKWSVTQDSASGLIRRTPDTSSTYKELIFGWAYLEFNSDVSETLINDWALAINTAMYKPTGTLSASSSTQNILVQVNNAYGIAKEKAEKPLGMRAVRVEGVKGLQVYGNWSVIKALVFGAPVRRVYIDRVAFALLQATLGSKVNLTELHTKGYTGVSAINRSRTVNVAVIDSGVCHNSPDLQGAFISGYDSSKQPPVSGPTVGDDDMVLKDGTAVYHGTHVAGIVHSIAPGGKIAPVKALDKNGLGQITSILAAMAHVEKRSDVHIVNMSLGADVPKCNGKSSLCPLCEGASRMKAAGKLVVVSAGNSGPNPSKSTILHPGSSVNVVTVGSVGENNRVSWFSSRGKGEVNKPDIAAYGENVKSSSCGAKLNTGNTMSGTSQAAPYLSGVAALVLQYLLDTQGGTTVAGFQSLLLKQVLPETANQYETGRGIVYPAVLLGTYPCPQGKVWDDATLKCVAPEVDCPEGYAYDTMKEECVTECPDGYRINTETGLCESICGEDQFWNPAKKACEVYQSNQATSGSRTGLYVAGGLLGAGVLGLIAYGATRKN